jgi:hypothetical protein
MPPTEAQIVRDIYKRIHDIALEAGAKKMPLEDAASIIKQFCKTVSAYNVAALECNYDGSGDSGDMDIYVLLLIPPPRRSGAHDERGENNIRNTRSFRLWRDDILNEPNTVITKELLEQFEEACFELLPAGWEIDEGSFGAIYIDVTTETIRVEHSERIVEVTTTTQTF